MGEKPFFTILTASLNSGASIRSTLESAKGQTLQDLEHIVVDGVSTDDTIDILQTFSGTYDLRWISEPDKGIADALNKGLMMAKGRYVVVIQADDHLLASDTLEKVYPLLKEEVFDIHSFPVVLNHPRFGKVLRKPIRALWWNHFKFVFLHQGSFVNRRVFERVGPFRKDFSINLDYDFFYRALSMGCSVKFGEFPVAVMGSGGIGSDPRFMARRLEEEARVQILNEQDPLWRLAQSLFRAFYGPYKKASLSLLKRSDRA